MITYQSVTDGVSRCRYSRTSLDALRGLVQYELGFGGYLTRCDIQNNTATIELKTHIMSHTDIVTFTGSLQDMAVLLKAIRIWVSVKQQIGAKLAQTVLDQIAAIDSRTLFVVHGGDLITGISIAKQIYLQLLEVQGDDIHKLLSQDLDTLHDLFCMKGECSYAELMELAN